MKVLLVDDSFGVLLNEYGGFVDSSVVAYIKSHYIQSLSWNSLNDTLDYSFGENFPGTTYSINVFPNAFRYVHTYTIRPTTAFNYETISFTVFTNLNHSMSVNELRNWFIAGGFYDTSVVNKIGKKLYPASGIGAINNNVPYVATGLCYYSETQGIIISYTLYVYCNYGSYFSVDESTLNCTSIIDLFSGKRLL